MKVQNIVKAVFGTVFAASLAYGADIYVSPTGSDADAGTMAAPYATLTKARDAADLVKSGGTVIVWLRSGTYYLSAPVVFSDANSGTSTTAPIIYQSYPGEKAVISGGIKLPSTTTWTSTTINGVTVQKTTITSNLHVDQLFLNGKRQILARYPNYNPSVKVLGGNSSDAVSKAGTCASPAEGPGYIRAIHSSSWGGNDYIITGKNGSTVTYQWVGDNNRGSGYGAVMVENIYELLDAPGEWFYRKSTGDLWFYPPTGANLSTSTIELASISQLLRFVGTSGTSASSVKYITFNNVTFTHAFRSLFDSSGQFYEFVTGSDWGICRKGAVFMQNAENITIENCLFDQVGGNGVFMSAYNRHNVVYNCDFENTGANCVCLFGLRSSIRCPNSWVNGNLSNSCPNKDRTPGPLTDDYPSYCVVDNNMMDTLGVFEKQVSGVASSATQFDTIRHNTICHMPRAGINYCDGCWGGTLVDYNWVFDCVRETSDHGPFNAWGRDRNAMNMGDVTASLLDAQNPTVLRMNRFESPGMFGIDLDDNATNYYQEKNLVIGGGYKVQAERYNTYINGILVTSEGNGDVQFHILVSNSHNYGARNIVFAKQSCPYQVYGLSDAQNAPSYLAQWDSNEVYTTTGSAVISGWNNCGGTQETWAQWTGSGLDKHSITTNPGFVDTQKVFRTGYSPRGDYNPTNTAALNTLHFQTFAMDSFGVMGISGLTSVRNNPLSTNSDISTIDKITVNYGKGRLIVANDGNYKVVVTTVSGRMAATFNGKGRSIFTLDARKIGNGVFFAAVHTKNSLVSRRFIVSNNVP